MWLLTTRSSVQSLTLAFVHYILFFPRLRRNILESTINKNSKFPEPSRSCFSFFLFLLSVFKFSPMSQSPKCKNQTIQSNKFLFYLNPIQFDGGRSKIQRKRRLFLRRLHHRHNPLHRSNQSFPKQSRPLLKSIRFLRFSPSLRRSFIRREEDCRA